MILDGKKIKGIILDEVKDEVKNIFEKIKLVVIQIGNDSASDIYVKQKRNMCEYVGFDFECIKLDEDVNTYDVIDIINNLNNDDSVTGILVQLPIPKRINKDDILNSINPMKDVDGLNEFNRARFLENKDCFVPCTVLGVMELLDRYNISLTNRNVVILGNSNIVGKPLGVVMKNSGSRVTICDTKTKGVVDYCKNADILISAIGKANFVNSDMVKDGVVIIDVGINKDDNGICGDVDYLGVIDKVSYITPVPGGVGPMTVAMLSKNMLKSYKSK